MIAIMLATIGAAGGMTYLSYSRAEEQRTSSVSKDSHKYVVDVMVLRVKNDLLSRLNQNATASENEQDVSVSLPALLYMMGTPSLVERVIHAQVEFADEKTVVLKEEGKSNFQCRLTPTIVDDTHIRLNLSISCGQQLVGATQPTSQASVTKEHKLRSITSRIEVTFGNPVIVSREATSDWSTFTLVQANIIPKRQE
jgi:hypothetical protein